GREFIERMEMRRIEMQQLEIGRLRLLILPLGREPARTLKQLHDHASVTLSHGYTVSTRTRSGSVAAARAFTPVPAANAAATSAAACRTVGAESITPICGILALMRFVPPCPPFVAAGLSFAAARIRESSRTRL